MDKQKAHPLPEGMDKSLGSYIVRLSKVVEIAGNKLEIPEGTEFQTFSAAELKQFAPSFEASKIKVAILHDPTVKQERKQKAVEEQLPIV